MDIVILSIDPVSVIAICIMIGTLIVAYAKKLMMTYALIIANFIVFILTIIFQVQTPYGPVSVIVWDLGFRPIYLSLDYSPQLYTLFTSMFIHGGFWHILMNMLVFFFMGTAFEQRIGWKKFLVIYLLTGVCGALTHSLFNLGSTVILIGASGAIFGILGAFAYSYPRDEVVMPIPVGIMLITRIKVIYAAVLFAAIETVYVYLGAQDQTAHLAHIGGLVSGVVLAALLIRGKRAERNAPSTIVYYDSFSPQKTRKIGFSNLKKLAETQEQKEMLKRIESETVPQVRDIWLEHFFEKTNCPRCGKPLKFFNGKVWCEDCGFKTNY